MNGSLSHTQARAHAHLTDEWPDFLPIVVVILILFCVYLFYIRFFRFVAWFQCEFDHFVTRKVWPIHDGTLCRNEFAHNGTRSELLPTIFVFLSSLIDSRWNFDGICALNNWFRAALDWIGCAIAGSFNCVEMASKLTNYCDEMTTDDRWMH